MSKTEGKGGLRVCRNKKLDRERTKKSQMSEEFTGQRSIQFFVRAHGNARQFPK